MFSFNPLSDEQIHAVQNRGLLEEGIYSFTVKAMEAQQSKSGNPMLKVRIGVLASEGDERNIIDYLLSSEQMMFKLKHFCESIGLEDNYLKGNLSPSDCINRSGKVRIGVQKGGAKEDGSGFFPDKNSVKDYVKVEAKAAPVVDDKPPFDDDIKF